ncbi:MAG: DNA replication complex GINS family protein [Methanosphaera sp.]|nr:DNA replication complex GINS family protein [Methanosphaera sp.]
MDTFFQTLRDIQKKERATGTLSEVDEGFYGDASKYLQDLLKIVNDNPLSLEAYQLRDAQRITSEICERREVKIITSAITNVQRSHNLFKGHDKNSQLYDEIPYNTTPEEEQLYREVVDKLISYREGLISNITPQKKKTNKIGFKPIKPDNETVVREDILEESARDDIAETSNSDATESNDNLMDIADVSSVDSSVDSKVKNIRPKKLDATQVAAMFGQAPDDVLLDEDNNPVRQKATGSMTAPIEGPEVPDNDSVTLQNNENAEISDEINASSDAAADSNSSTFQVEEILTDSADDKTTLSASDEDNQVDTPVLVDESQNHPEMKDDDADESADGNVGGHDSVIEDSFDDEELVEFVNILPTDVLDEDEKTYGPFDIQDVALLPKSIVKILKNNNVVNIIK